jgi:hypothetical protein
MPYSTGVILAIASKSRQTGGSNADGRRPVRVGWRVLVAAALIAIVASLLASGTA